MVSKARPAAVQLIGRTAGGCIWTVPARKHRSASTVNTTMMIGMAVFPYRPRMASLVVVAERVM